VTDQTSSLYSPGNVSNSWEELTSIVPTLPNQNTSQYPTNFPFQVSQSIPVQNLTTNFDPYSPNLVDASYMGGLTQTMDPRIQTVQSGRQISAVNDDVLTNNQDGLSMEAFGWTNEFYGLSQGE